MVKKCFTINQFRSRKEINSYKVLLLENLYQGIEIFYPYDIGNEGFQEYTKSIKELVKYNCEVVMHLPFGPKNDLCDPINFSKTVTRLKEAIDYSKQFKINKYTLHLGFEHHNRDQNLSHIKNILKNLSLYCEGILMIENMPGKKEIGYSPLEILDIITSVNRKNVGFILDIGHANVSEYRIEEYIKLLKNYLTHIHLHDNNGIRDEHQRIGKGNINFKSLIQNLTDYPHLYCLEILYQDVNDLIKYSNDFDEIIEEVEDEKN